MAKKIGIIIDFLTETYKNRIDEAAARCGYETQYFDSSRAAVGNVDDCEIIYGHPSQKVIASAANLKWFACCWAGVDHFCKDGLFQNPDCILTNSSGAYGDTISEHVVMVSLMLLRRQMEYTEIIRERGWRVLDGGIRSLYGSRITVLGTGDIGTQVARRMRAFRPQKIVGVRRNAKLSADFDEIRTVDELDKVLPETDLLVMALPSTPDTVGLISREKLAMLPAGALLVNVGRGTAIDQQALMDALNSGALAGASLDVVVPEPLPEDHPLRDTKNLLLTPHVAGNMTLGHTCDLNVEMFVENLKAYISGEPMKHVVDKKKGY